MLLILFWDRNRNSFSETNLGSLGMKTIKRPFTHQNIFQKGINNKMAMWVGYRFAPTEEEILTILKNRTMGIPPPHGVVEKNLYGVDSTPWKLFDDNEGWGIVVDSSSCKASPNAAVIYVITQLSKVGNGGKNFTRTAGCGTWHGSAKGKSIKNWMGQEIGKMRALNFISKTEEVRGHWIMHEYALSGVLLGPGTSMDYVICRITRRVDDDSAAKLEGCGKRKAVPDAAEENPELPVFDFQESQHSSKKSRSGGSTEQEDGDEGFAGWIVETIDFDTFEGAAVDQQHQNFEWVEVDQNYQNAGGEIEAGASDQQHQNFEWVGVDQQHCQNVEGETVGAPADQHCLNFEGKGQMGGVAVDQQFQNNTSHAMGYDLMTGWTDNGFVDNLFAEEDSRGCQFPDDLINNYLVPCLG